MEYFHTLDFQIQEPSIISFGKFDGIHTGHKFLLEELRKGQEKGLKSIIFTFDIPPKAVSSESYSVLSTKEEKNLVFDNAGIDVLIECPFTEEIRQMEPEDFLKMITEKINIKKIVTGTDFRFGHNRSGDYNDILSFADDAGYVAQIVEKKQYKGKDISSTRIRDCIMNGEIEEANKMLGYPYFLISPIVHGNAIGREIGIATANQLPQKEKLLPPYGVYAVIVQLGESSFHGICNIGCKPTVGPGYAVGVETHIFGFTGDIYGQVMKVAFCRFIRAEKKFSSLSELTLQMKADIDTCKAYFEKSSC